MVDLTLVQRVQLKYVVLHVEVKETIQTLLASSSTVVDMPTMALAIQLLNPNKQLLVVAHMIEQIPQKFVTQVAVTKKTLPILTATLCIVAGGHLMGSAELNKH